MKFIFKIHPNYWKNKLNCAEWFEDSVCFNVPAVTD